jgi:hypothetical protein
MQGRFDQITMMLQGTQTTGRIKVSRLMGLLEHHPYKNEVEKTFGIENIGDDYILIDYIDVVFNKLSLLFKDYERFNVKAHTKDILLEDDDIEIEGISGTPIKFIFEQYVDHNGTELNGLEAFAIHDTKNTFLDQYEMSKYANRLYKDGHFDMARWNIEYFKSLAAGSNGQDKQKSYRLLAHKGELFVRGITSVKQYNEYGVDFAFVVSMLLFHQLAKKNPEDTYVISSAAVSASKLELIVSDRNLKDAKGFGKVASSTIISTNDLGNESFRFLNIVKVGILDSRGFYIFPDPKKDYKNEVAITHNTKVETALQTVKEAESIIRSSDEFIRELENVKDIAKPEELRGRIVLKLESNNSPFRKISSVRDLFKTVISNSIENFAKLLDMCRKAEELEIDYDLKEKLRYIISDIILNKR